MGLICTPFGYSGAAKVSGIVNYSSTILADHPVAYWPLNETSGTVAHDLSGNGNNLNISGFTVAQSAIGTGLGLCMLSQSGSAAMTPVNALNEIPTGDSEYTLEIWAQNTAAFATNNNLLSYGATETNETNGFQIYTGSGPLLVNYWLSDNVGIDYAFEPNVLYHLVATYNGSERVLYVNGSLLGSVSSSGMSVPSSGNFAIGDNVSVDVPALVGFYSNVAIYNTALTAQQVLNHYNAGIA